MRPIPQAAVDLIKKREKCVLTCYDTDGAKKPTIGWGHTKGLSPADVGQLTITQEKADRYCDDDMIDAAVELRDQIGDGPIDAMTDNQYAALIVFMFNVGSMGPTLRALLRAKRFDAVPIEMSKYVNAHVDGKVVKVRGLVNRRADEVALWSEGEPGVVDVHIPSGTLRAIATPPSPGVEAARPLGTQPQFITAAATAIGTGAVAAQPVVSAVSTGLQQVSGAIEPFADANAHVAAVRGAILTALAALAVITLVLVWLKHATAVAETDGAPNNVAKPPGQ